MPSADAADPTAKYLEPEQRARMEIDRQLAACGWVVQDYKHAAVAAAQGVAVREVPTEAGPADYVLFVDRQATETTWNPSTGCDRTSYGCDNCYALTLAKRLKAMGNPRYQNDGDPKHSGAGFGLTLHEDLLELPYRWRAPRVVFVNSMSDLFHADVPLDFIQRVFKVMADTDRHTYQILTKRSKRLASLADQLDWPRNVWMGVSVESKRYAFRIDHLRSVPAAIRFISAEPLLGPLPNLDLSSIHWLIAGGESGHNARPMSENWVLDLRDQCAAAGVDFFFKQWGGRTPKANGRHLDGELHDHMPTRPDSVAA